MTGTTPANDTTTALVDTPAAPVKPASLRALERALRGIGYSQREATIICKSGFAALGNAEPDDDLSALKAALAKNTLIFESKDHD